MAPTWERPPRSLSSGLGGTLQGFFWAMAACASIGAVSAVVTLVLFNDWWNADFASRAEAQALDNWETAEDILVGMSGAMFLCGLVAFVLLVIWMNNAHHASSELWSGPRSWTSGWTVGGWFIPVANLVIPKLVVNEIERIAMAPRRDGLVTDVWRTTPTSVVGWVWWLAFVFGVITNAIGNGLGDEPGSSVGEVRIGYVFNAGGLALIAVGAVAGALFVRRVGARLSADGLSQPT